ncbi:hypothetical protein [Isoptericola dokdonensis]|uniref:Holin n=1 Tax=Isoptericola dokdonensis DS-3 TaxID=1300344 RepID=A0A161ILM0_9MICO|nr:hypothetical protein [Isoptericola dokdonensis]ANC31420.1 hypothetical protein I598_1872 [Isoptericola dokdonensis DS-3]
MKLFTAAFWRAAGIRAAKTAITVVTPWIPQLVATPTSEVVVAAASTTALAVVLSVATSLASLPEVAGKVVPLWRALAGRAARTFGQTIVATVAGATLLTDVNWLALGLQVVASVIGTVLLGLYSRLPEVPEVDDGEAA